MIRTLLFSIISIALFLIPFIFSRSTAQSFELPKFVFFLLFTAVIFLLFAGFAKKIVITPSKNLRNVLILLGLFFIGLLQATILSDSLAMAFWGGSVHHQGFLFFANLFLLGVVTFLLYPTRKETILFFCLPLIAAGLIESAIAIAQYFIPNFLFSDFISYASENRSFGTFGQPNTLARFLLIPFFLTAFLIVWGIFSSHEFSLGTGEHALQFSHFSKNQRIVLFLAFGGTTVLILLGIFTTGSRTALVALFLGILFFLSVLRKWKYVFGFMGVAIFLGGVLFTVFPEKFIRPESIDTRIELWKATPKVIAEKPILGHGLESFQEVFPPYMPEILVNLESANRVPDRVHNEFLDFVIQIGVPFGIAILAFFLLLFWKSAHRYRDDPLFLGITTVIFVLFLARQTEWGNTIEYFVTALFIALLLIPKNPKPIPLPSFSQYAFRGFLVLWGVLSVFAAMNYWQSDVAYDNATTEQISEERKTYELYLAYQSMYWEPKYGLVYADRLAEIGEFEKAEEVLEYVQSTHPQYGDVYFIAARISWRKGETETAHENFQKAVERAPARPVFWKEWGMFLNSKNLPGAEEKVRRYQELVE